MNHPNMPLYEGTKRLRAVPMTRGDYNSYRGWITPVEEDPTDQGYLVEYEEGGKPNDARHKGYISWSPKAVFEGTYKLLGTATNPTADFDQLHNLLYTAQRTAGEVQAKAIGDARILLSRMRATQKPAIQEPSPTAGMTLERRILHVGGRNNKEGYVEFGSVEAVAALVRQVLRDLPNTPFMRPDFVGVPTRLTPEMEAVLATEDWQWADLLAAANAVTESEYAELKHPSQIKALKDVVHILWDVYAFGKFLCRVASPPNWDATSVHTDLVRAGYSENIEVSKVCDTNKFVVTDEEIKSVFLANGFTIKEGLTDLKPYVYTAARQLLELAPSKAMDAEHWAELHKLRAEANRSDGTPWQTVAVQERVLRTEQQRALKALPRITYGYKGDGGGNRSLTAYADPNGQFLRHADVMAILDAPPKDMTGDGLPSTILKRVLTPESIEQALDAYCSALSYAVQGDVVAQHKLPKLKAALDGAIALLASNAQDSGAST